MKFSIILLSLFISQLGRAQLPDYYVYLVAGDAILKKKSGKSVVIKQHELVFKTDSIILRKGARLTLVDRDASYLVLTAPKSYFAANLPNQVIKKGNDGVTSKYLKLLFHELLDPSQDFDKFKKNNVAGIAGGVSRGDDCGNLIFPINGLRTSTNTIVFRWHKTSSSSNYALSFYDADQKDLATIKVNDTVRTVNISETLKRTTGKYFWVISSDDGVCEIEIPYYFDLLTPADEQRQAEQLLKLGGESIEEQLQQIDKLEKKAFINIASARYGTLVKANPDNKALLKSYVVFLLKYGFEEEAKAAWKP